MEAVGDYQERRWVQRIIELTEGGEIKWDFSQYTELYLMDLIQAKYKDLALLSYHLPDAKNEFYIHQKGELFPVRFSHPMAKELRRFLVELARKNPEVRERWRGKATQLKTLITCSTKEQQRLRQQIDEILGE